MLKLLKNINKFDIILASKSPRRCDLLKMIGLKFRVCPSNVEENYQDYFSPVEYVTKNAKKKNENIAEKYPESLVISADTIVVLNNEILEKPDDKEHAEEILKKLSGKTHKVITGFGVSVHSRRKSLYAYETTKVTFRDLTDIEIEAYCKTGEPFDKAGGYGAQGIGSMIIEKVDGCFFNVVGLPLSKFYTIIRQFLENLG
jgi:septum formation protein